MIILKRLHRFVLSSFLPLFAMTFLIVLFIVLMQFLWKYIDDLVGKGLAVDVIGELFFYAAVSMVPMALPLAILLASLMTFGNFGEKFELTAMKAAGLSLIQVMAPLIVLIGGISIGAFFFQNDVLPKAQVKMWTLLFSMRQKSPEVEIPEGVFYDQIPGYNLFVEKKNSDTGMLYGVMIYDVSQGGDNSTILLADSAQLAFTPDMTHLFLHLFSGEQFENLREQRSMDRNVPFRREEFADKQVLIPFDANFNRMDDDAMRKQYVGKNMAELRQTIDSIGSRADSTGNRLAASLRQDNDASFRIDKAAKAGETRRNEFYGSQSVAARTYQKASDGARKLIASKSVRIDSLLARTEEGDRRAVLQQAVTDARNRATEAQFRTMVLEEDMKSIRRHEIELMKKFTLSVACLVFFFIGAPLGAIIRKGGLGTPLVISVCLFLVYYIIDNSGYKMARDGRWEVWAGIWLSTFVLAPLGAYVTYKAMNDSAVFDKDAYINLLRRITGARQNRMVEYKEIVITDISPAEARRLLDVVRDKADGFLRRYSRWQNYVAYWMQGYDMNELRSTAEALEQAVAYLSDSRDRLLVNKLMDFPVLSMLWIYHPARKKWLSRTLAIFVPFGVPLWLVGIQAQKRLKEDLRTVIRVAAQVEEML